MIMKRTSKTFMYVAAVAAFASCAKVEIASDKTEVENTPAANLEVVKFNTAEISTKTSVGADNKTVTWDAEDIIAIFDGQGVREFMTTEGGKTAVFEGEAAVGATEYYALYPYNAVSTLTEGKITTSVAASQNGEFANHISVAYTTAAEKKLAFKNVTAVVKVTLDEDYVTKVTLKGNNNEIIAGDLSIDYNQGEPIVTVTNGLSAVSVGDGSTVMTKKDYYFVVAPQNLENGFTLTLTYKSDSKTYWEQWLDAKSTKKTIGVRTIDKKGDNSTQLSNGTLLDLGNICMTKVIFEDAATDISHGSLYGYSTADPTSQSIVTENVYSGTSAVKMVFSNSKWSTMQFNIKNGNTPKLDISNEYNAGFYLEFAFKTSDQAVVDKMSVRISSYSWNYISVTGTSGDVTTASYMAAYRNIGDYAKADGNWYLVRIPLCDMYPGTSCWNLAGNATVSIPNAYWGTHATRVQYPFLWNEVYRIDFGMNDIRNTPANTAIGTFYIDHISIKKHIQ